MLSLDYEPPILVKCRYHVTGLSYFIKVCKGICDLIVIRCPNIRDPVVICVKRQLHFGLDFAVLFEQDCRAAPKIKHIQFYNRTPVLTNYYVRKDLAFSAFSVGVKCKIESIEEIGSKLNIRGHPLKLVVP